MIPATDIAAASRIWIAAYFIFLLFFPSALNAFGSAAGGQPSRLAPCPGKPNCVCSDDSDPDRRVSPYRLKAAPQEAWESLLTLMTELPRVKVVAASDTDIEAEVKSRIFGFVDDVVFQLRPEENIIAVRSASRTGYYDLGVNRKRIEAIRQRLQQLGVAE
jgi:uncharacterized protein (DUF1499 family)